MARYARRRDATHKPIQNVFESMLAGHVTDSSAWGQGAGDLFVTVPGHAGGWMIEIKIDAKQQLRGSQIAFKNRHPDAWLRCDSVDEAIQTCRYLRSLAQKP